MRFFEVFQLGFTLSGGSCRRKVNKSYRGRSCPIVVHCSDGAGRTGTYCLIDMVLSRMAKGAKEIDIAATLEHLRDQRPRMVSIRVNGIEGKLKFTRIRDKRSG